MTVSSLPPASIENVSDASPDTNDGDVPRQNAACSVTVQFPTVHRRNGSAVTAVPEATAISGPITKTILRIASNPAR
jgi:hypothetical protein